MRRLTIQFALALTTILLGVFAAAPCRAADATFAGKYTDGKLTIDLAESGGGYTGSITLSGQQYPASGQASGPSLSGTFIASGTTLPFSATRNGDTVTLTSGKTTYTLHRVAGGNPLDAAAGANPPPAGSAVSAPAAAGTDAPAGYTVEVATDSGKSLVTQKPNVATVQAALLATFPDLATYFGNRPTIGSAYQDAHDSTTGGATFAAVYNGRPVRGIVSCKLNAGVAAVVVVFGRTDAPKADWAKLMAPPPPPPAPAQQPGAAAPNPASASAAPAADAPDPNIPLKEYDYPDGTGSVGLADGWTTQGTSVVDQAVVTGPANQIIALRVSNAVSMPDSMAVKQRQQMDAQRAQMDAQNQRRGLQPMKWVPVPPLLVAPFTDPATALGDLMPQFSNRSVFNKGASLMLDKILSVQPESTQIANGKRAIITFAFTKTLNGQSIAFREQADCLMYPMSAGMWLWFNNCFVQGPEATFDHDLPIMLAMLKSQKANQDRVQEVFNARLRQQQQQGQEILAEGARQQQARFEQFQADQQRQFAQHQQYMAQTQAGYDAHNQQFRDYEVQRSRNAADFNESIIGTRTIYDTVTGQSGYANLTDVNGVVDSLNQAALDPNRFVQIPLRDQLYPVQPGR